MMKGLDHCSSRNTLDIQGEYMEPLHIGSSNTVAFSGDGTRLATTGRYLWVWDISKREKLWRAHPFPHPGSVAFSPDGNRLAVSNATGRICILSSTTGQTLIDFNNGDDGEGSNIAYSVDGLSTVSGSWDGRIRIRCADSGDIEFEQEFPGEMIVAVHRCTDSDDWIVAHSIKATRSNRPPPAGYFSVWRWPFAQDGFESVPMPKHRESVAFSPNDELVAVSTRGRNPKVLVVRLSDGKRVAGVKVPPGVHAMDWTRDMSLLAVTVFGKVIFYRWPGLKPVAEVAMEHGSGLAFSPRGDMVALGAGKDGLLLGTDTLDV